MTKLRQESTNETKELKECQTHLESGSLMGKREKLIAKVKEFNLLSIPWSRPL
jgi:hypothetical protein